MVRRLAVHVLAMAFAAAACSKTSKPEPPSSAQFPVGRVCVGPAGAPFDPLAAVGLAPVPHAPTAWWKDAAIVLFASGCHSSSETLTGVPTLARAGSFAWTVGGSFTGETPRDRPLLADCGSGHFGYHLGPLEAGHHEIRVAGSTFAFDVPPADPAAQSQSAPTVSDWSCFDVPVGEVTGPSVPPSAVVQPFTPPASPPAPPPVAPPVAPRGPPPADAGTPAPADWCTFENGYVCPVGFNCCAAGPARPGHGAPCNMPLQGLDRFRHGGNICK